MKKYFHKKGETAVKLSYFHTSRIVKESPYWGKGTLSALYTGEDEEFSGLRFINSRYIKYGKKIIIKCLLQDTFTEKKKMIMNILC